jgi:hypothetical protein
MRSYETKMINVALNGAENDNLLQMLLRLAKLSESGYKYEMTIILPNDIGNIHIKSKDFNTKPQLTRDEKLDMSLEEIIEYEDGKYVNDVDNGLDDMDEIVNRWDGAKLTDRKKKELLNIELGTISEKIRRMINAGIVWDIPLCNYKYNKIDQAIGRARRTTSHTYSPILLTPTQKLDMSLEEIIEHEDGIYVDEVDNGLDDMNEVVDRWDCVKLTDHKKKKLLDTELDDFWKIDDDEQPVGFWGNDMPDMIINPHPINKRVGDAKYILRSIRFS